MFVIPALKRLRQRDCEFEARMGYINDTLSQKKKKK
jgi:hypothetical protein